jgi:cyclopropane-fatty-acyl-phospholipid synthase
VRSIVAQEIQKFGAAVPFAFEVEFADGSRYRNRDGPCRFSIRFRDRAVEWGIVAFGHMGMVDGYIDGAIDVEGDLRAALQAGMSGTFTAPNPIVVQRNRWHEFRYSNASRAKAKENARAHYGLGTDFSTTLT